jgi:hypothetical protein
VVAVPALLELGLLLLTLALAVIATLFVEALFGSLIRALKAIGLGGIVTDWLKSIEHAITSALAGVERGIDSGIGHSFHAFARLLDWQWREIKAHALALLKIATPVGALVELYRGVRALVHHLSHSNSLRASQVKTIEHELHGIEVKLKHLEHDVAKGIGDDVLPRIKSLDRELHKVTHETIPAIRAAENSDALSIGNLWDWVRSHVAVPGTAVFTGAVAIALSSLGLGWLRCNSNPFNNNRNACGLWGDLARLLEIAAIPLEIATIYELVEVAQKVTEDVTRGVEALLDV